MANMGELLQYYYSLLLLSLVTFQYMIISSTSSSVLARPLHDDEPNKVLVLDQKKLLQFSLRRVDSDKNLTLFERVRRAAERSEYRYQTLITTSTTATDYVVSQVQKVWGEFVMDLAIGSPPLFYAAILDTGSQLIWTQCQPCQQQQCAAQATPIFNPINSSTYSPLSCSSDFCHDFSVSSCADDDHCAYTYGYAGGTTVNGSMGTETFTFGDWNSPSTIPNLAFGCANSIAGPFGQFHEAGIVGLGHGSLSLNAQLQIGTFAYCFTSLNSSSSSNLLMGWKADQFPVPVMQTTPMMTRSSRPSFYYVQLNGVSVGGTQVKVAPSAFADGMIIDSGTTFSRLPSSVMAVIGDMIFDMTKLGRASDPRWPVCLQAGAQQEQLPSMVLQFENMELELEGERLWLNVASDVVCLAINDGDDHLLILGNTQQTNMQVVYDIDNGYLGFTATDCDGY
ncbi:hypothetical protein Dimus_011969 [Dionaea muscipula]